MLLDLPRVQWPVRRTSFKPVDPAAINFASGFPSATGLQLNGASKVSSSNFLELTDGGDYEASSAFWTTPVNIQTFTTNFTFQLSSATADGFTFTIQDAGLTALGAYGGGLGYGPDPNNGPTASIGKSVAIKFDIYSNSGEGNRFHGTVYGRRHSYAARGEPDLFRDRTGQRRHHCGPTYL